MQTSVPQKRLGACMKPSHQHQQQARLTRSILRRSSGATTLLLMLAAPAPDIIILPSSPVRGPIDASPELEACGDCAKEARKCCVSLPLESCIRLRLGCSSLKTS